MRNAETETSGNEHHAKCSSKVMENIVHRDSGTCHRKDHIDLKICNNFSSSKGNKYSSSFTGFTKLPDSLALQNRSLSLA